MTQFLLPLGLRLYSSPYQPVYQSRHPMIPPLIYLCLSLSPSANRGCPSIALISVFRYITTSVLSSLGSFVSLSMPLHVCLSVSVTLPLSLSDSVKCLIACLWLSLCVSLILPFSPCLSFSQSFCLSLSLYISDCPSVSVLFRFIYFYPYVFWILCLYTLCMHGP